MLIMPAWPYFGSLAPKHEQLMSTLASAGISWMVGSSIGQCCRREGCVTSLSRIRHQCPVAAKFA